MFEYAARVKSVYDGDTFRADVDLGFGFWASKFPFRLNGLNTPELREAGGKEARSFVREYLSDNAVLKIKTEKDRTEKYGRYLADVSIMRTEGWVSLNGLLIKEGFAKMWDGTGARP